MQKSTFVLHGIFYYAMQTKLFFLIIGLILSISSTAQEENISFVSLSGKVLNYVGMVNLIDLSEKSDFRSLDLVGFPLAPDSNGYFNFSFVLESPEYFLIGYNELYLEPFDSLYMEINLNDPKLSFFSGKGHRKQAYLKDIPFYNAGSYLDAGRNVYQDHQKTIDTVLSLAHQQEENLSKLVRSESKEFIALEKARIKADVLNSFQRIVGYFSHTFGKGGSEEEQLATYSEINNYIKPYQDSILSSLLDSTYMKLPNYRNLSSIILKTNKNADPATISYVEDWLLASRLNRQLVHAVEQNDDVSLINVKEQSEKLKNSEYRTLLMEKAKTLGKLNVGAPALDVTFLDTDGNQINLSDLKGKPIYIDFWATWCAPCIAERPYLAVLKEKFDQSVHFVSLSIDSDRERWQKYMNKEAEVVFNYDGWVDNYSIAPYNVLYIPRCILIDADFNLVDLNAPHPSSSEIIDLLEQVIRP